MLTCRFLGSAAGSSGEGVDPEGSGHQDQRETAGNEVSLTVYLNVH